jgi:CheY-like chemotaxis protein
VLTSSLAPDEQQEAKRLGADRYLKKPADLYQFLNDVGIAICEMLQIPKPARIAP